MDANQRSLTTVFPAADCSTKEGHCTCFTKVLPSMLKLLGRTLHVLLRNVIQHAEAGRTKRKDQEEGPNRKDQEQGPRGRTERKDREEGPRGRSKRKDQEEGPRGRTKRKDQKACLIHMMVSP